MVCALVNDDITKASSISILFSGALCCRSRVLPASRRQIVRSRIVSFCRQDAGSTLGDPPNEMRAARFAIQSSLAIQCTRPFRPAGRRTAQASGPCYSHRHADLEIPRSIPCAGQRRDLPLQGRMANRRERRQQQENCGNVPAKCLKEEQASFPGITINKPTPAPSPSPSCYREIRKIRGRISSTHVRVFRVFRGSKSVNQHQDNGLFGRFDQLVKLPFLRLRLFELRRHLRHGFQETHQETALNRVIHILRQRRALRQSRSPALLESTL